jgi:hypothetical protein
VPGIVVAAALLVACTPTRSTIGGYPPEDLAKAADAAARDCERRRGAGHVPPAPFTTDGCSLWPDGSWQGCCVDHDTVYWCGGSARERQEADAALRACVVDRGAPRTGGLMYWGVRAGGHPWLPVPWRWGYGWPWPHGYD